jgi:hypothetical protein
MSGTEEYKALLVSGVSILLRRRDILVPLKHDRSRSEAETDSSRLPEGRTK